MRYDFGYLLGRCTVDLGLFVLTGFLFVLPVSVLASCLHPGTHGT
jgi:hypothetical protein